MSSVRPEEGSQVPDRRIVIPIPPNIYQPNERRGSDRLWKKAATFGAGVLVGAGVVTGTWMGSNLPERTQVESISTFRLFNQRDSIWALGNPHWYWRAGCGPTAVAMIINNFENNTKITPSTIDKEFEAKKIREKPSDGTMFRSGPGGQYDGIQWLRDRGYEVKQIQDQAFPSTANKKEFDFKEAKIAINEGYKFIVSGIVNWVEIAPDGADHIMVAIDVDEARKTIKLADPWGGVVREVKLDKANFKDGELNYAYAVRFKKSG